MLLVHEGAASIEREAAWRLLEVLRAEGLAVELLGRGRPGREAWRPPAQVLAGVGALVLLDPRAWWGQDWPPGRPGAHAPIVAEAWKRAGGWALVLERPPFDPTQAFGDESLDALGWARAPWGPVAPIVQGLRAALAEASLPSEDALAEGDEARWSEARIERDWVRLEALPAPTRMGLIGCLELACEDPEGIPGAIVDVLVVSARGDVGGGLARLEASPVRDWLVRSEGRFTLADEACAVFLGTERGGARGMANRRLSCLRWLVRSTLAPEAARAYADAGLRALRIAGAGVVLGNQPRIDLRPLERASVAEMVQRLGAIEAELRELVTPSASLGAEVVVELTRAVGFCASRGWSTKDPAAFGQALWTALVARGWTPALLEQRLRWPPSWTGAAARGFEPDSGVEPEASGVEARPAVRLRSPLSFPDLSREAHDCGNVSLNGVGISADGSTLAAMTNMAELRVWRGSAVGEAPQTMGFESWGSCFAMSGDGRYLVVGCGDGGVHHVDIGARGSAGAKFPLAVRKLEARGARPTALAVSADGDAVLVGDEDGRLLLWEPLRGGQSTRVLAQGEAKITACALGVEARVAVSGDSEGALTVWDLDRFAPRHTLEAHPYEVRAVLLEPAEPGGASELRLLSICYRETRLWSVASGERLETHEEHGCFAVGGCFVAGTRAAEDAVLLASSDDGVTRFSLGDGAVLQRHRACGGSLGAAASTPDASCYVTGGNDGLLRVWHAADLGVEPPPHGGLDPHAVLIGTDEERWWSSGGGALLIAAQIETGRVHQRLESGCYFDMTLVDERTFAGVGSGKTVELRDRATGALVCASPEQGDWLRAVCFDRDERKLIYAGDSGEVASVRVEGVGSKRRRGAPSMAEPESIATLSNAINACLLTPGGVLVLATASAELHGWTRHGLPLWTVHSERDAVYYALCHAPKVGVVAAAGTGGGIDLWTLDDRVGYGSQLTPTLKTRLLGHRGGVTSLVLGPPGSEGVLVTGGHDGSVRFWQLEEERELTRVELPWRIMALGLVGTRIVGADEAGNRFVLDVDWAWLR